MSHSGVVWTKEDLANIASSGPLRVPAVLSRGALGVSVLSFLAFGCSVLFGDERARDLAWISFHVGFVYWFAVAAACSGFTAVFHICNAQWVRPLRRVFESFAPYLVFSSLGFILLFFGRHSLFVWADSHAQAHGIWFNSYFVFTRDFLGVLVLGVLSLVVCMLSVKRDVFAIKGKLVPISLGQMQDWKKRGCPVCFAGEEEVDALKKISRNTALMGRLSPVVVICYAFILSLVAFDQFMSVEPHWFSTLYGVMFFMSAVYLAVAWVSIGVFFLRKHPLFRQYIKPATLHDLGKLLFGFGIFWAYMFWSHYLTIWYGNIPHETSWMVVRMREEPWHGFAWATFVMCFVIPFFLGLSRDLKQVPLLLALTGLIVAIGVYMQFYLLFVPGIFPHEIPFSWREPVLFAGFMSLCLFFCLRFLSKMPLMSFGDLLERGYCGE